MKLRAQGTIEYLVLIGIIVVVSLALVMVVLSLTENNDSIKTSKKISNLTNTIPIMDASLSKEGDALIVLKNNTGNYIEITKLKLDGQEADYNSKNLLQFDEEAYLLNDLNECACERVGENKTCELIIYYISNGIEKQTTSNIILDCINIIIPKDNTIFPNNPNDITPPTITLALPIGFWSNPL